MTDTQKLSNQKSKLYLDFGGSLEKVRKGGLSSVALGPVKRTVPPPKIRVEKVLKPEEKIVKREVKRVEKAIEFFKSHDYKNLIFFTLNVPPYKEFQIDKGGRYMPWCLLTTEQQYSILKKFLTKIRRHRQSILITCEFGTYNKFHFHGVTLQKDYNIIWAFQTFFCLRNNKDGIIKSHTFKIEKVKNPEQINKFYNYITKDVEVMSSGVKRHYKQGDWSFECTLKFYPLIKNI